MTWQPAHPGGIITCDAHGCTRKRRNYCQPSERDVWRSVLRASRVLDLCPLHRESGDPE